MILTNLRSSSINTFRGCPMAWFLEYSLGWPSGVNKAAIKGTVVHAVLELLACMKKADQECKKTITTDMGISRLKVADYLHDTKKLDKLTERLYNIHMEKSSQLKWEVRDKKDCITWVRKTLDSWNGRLDPRTLDIIEPEMFFDMEIVKPWSAYKYELPDGEVLQGFLRLRGTIDLTTILGNDIEVVDWKTGKFWDWTTSQPKTAEGLKNDIQVRMYHYILSKLYPDKQIIITMVYINNVGPISVYLNDADILKTENIIKKYFQTIKESSPTCTKSWKCNRFCEYNKTTFADTAVIPIKHTKILTMCEQTTYGLQHRSEQQILSNMVNGNIKDVLEKYNQG